MRVYVLRDLDPNGGYFAAQQDPPVKEDERPTVIEVRKVEDFPEDIWKFVLEGNLPVDDDESNDSTWAEWWPDAEPVWIRF